VFCTFVGALTIVIIANDFSDNDVRVLLIAFIIETICLYRFFKIKRFKNGITFLKDKNKIKNYSMLGLLLALISTSIIVLVSTFIRQLYSEILVSSILIMIVIFSVGLIILWLRKSTTLFYKDTLIEEEISGLNSELNIMKIQNKKLLDELGEKSILIHKYDSRISAMERLVNSKVEFSEDIGDTQTLIKNLKDDFKNENDRKKMIMRIEKTGNMAIDSIFAYFKEEAEKNKIELEVRVKNKIENVVRDIIPEGKLLTLIGDHIKNAIIAINHSESKHRKIIVTLGKVGRFYEISFSDTGIPFETDTLDKLGTKPITTHSKDGGTGFRIYDYI
jgi:signal transduction histidine kinase